MLDLYNHILSKEYIKVVNKVFLASEHEQIREAGAEWQAECQEGEKHQYDVKESEEKQYDAQTK